MCLRSERQIERKHEFVLLDGSWRLMLTSRWFPPTGHPQDGDTGLGDTETPAGIFKSTIRYVHEPQPTSYAAHARRASPTLQF